MFDAKILLFRVAAQSNILVPEASRGLSSDKDG